MHRRGVAGCYESYRPFCFYVIRTVIDTGMIYETKSGTIYSSRNWPGCSIDFRYVVLLCLFFPLGLKLLLLDARQ